MKTRRPFPHSGFTLLEIMLVVAIIALLLGAGFHYMGNTMGIAQDARVQSDLSTFEGKLKLYEAMNGNLPTAEQGLQALVTMPETDPKPTKWYQLMEKLPKDPWGNDYVYEIPGKHNPDSYDLFSPGKDRQPNTPDDIGNWEEKK
jgi:general secretion pathway protein G